jgi:hypothetical protein
MRICRRSTGGRRSVRPDAGHPSPNAHGSRGEPTAGRPGRSVCSDAYTAAHSADAPRDTCAPDAEAPCRGRSVRTNAAAPASSAGNASRGSACPASGAAGPPACRSGTGPTRRGWSSLRLCGWNERDHRRSGEPVAVGEHQGSVGPISIQQTVAPVPQLVPVTNLPAVWLTAGVLLEEIGQGARSAEFLHQWRIEMSKFVKMLVLAAGVVVLSSTSAMAFGGRKCNTCCPPPVCTTCPAPAPAPAPVCATCVPTCSTCNTCDPCCKKKCRRARRCRTCCVAVPCCAAPTCG